MDLSAVLLAIVVFLAATAACVILFQRLGFGSILGFIVAGVLIGPHTPGPVPVHAVDELQSIAELGVVLFMFRVGLEMRPEKVWQMRRLIFGLVLFLAVLFAAWAVEQVGISMTLGAFLLGMLLSASDLRYQIEATVAPFKQTLMGLFFIAVGMSIDVGALLVDWDMLLIQVPILLMLKLAVLGGLALAFGIGRSAAIRTGFYLSQVGEFAVERDIAVVQVAKRAGREVYFGDLYSTSTQGPRGRRARQGRRGVRDLARFGGRQGAGPDAASPLSAARRLRAHAHHRRSGCAGRQGHQARGHGLHREHAGARWDVAEGSRRLGSRCRRTDEYAAP